MKEKFLTRGNMALLAITFTVSVIVAVICSACGAERTTVLFSSASGGILSLLLIGGLFKIADLKSPMGPEAGILGIVLATILSTIIF